MSKIIDTKDWCIKDTNSIISFETTSGGGWEKWDRYISIEGKKAFHIGNICGTCSFFFERLGGANGSNQGISPKEISEEFRKGITNLEDVFLSKVSLILPSGDYKVLLNEVIPEFIELGTEKDYFSNEQVQVWGMNSFWGLPHYPKVKYYRGITKELSNNSKLFEFIVPTFPVGWLEEETIEMYKSLISKEVKPTALCLSVLDIKEPADYEEETKHIQHWCLTHYIIDGHHKVFSAATQNQPITLLSFLATKEGIADRNDLSSLLDNLKTV
ncbi:hypothetical protein LG307_21370 [Sutcliffiella horikoshii]|uniref:hypothetical protein n=1 Tax=Sutcliffiella horikoshii TaxID=79883 RepID=UPI00384E8F87